ncbi:hypothetical protein BB560_000941 [Smittium megazygosporum]|uniref:Uncharacterized protein n=1 Tax=Smittium megazygosporum TaxID=133381 RepID=A0A2T9ZJ65_9FUNG|nr:hypothetical protein BB560_000941 [Smittium megazygosporum]
MNAILTFMDTRVNTGQSEQTFPARIDTRSNAIILTDYFSVAMRKAGCVVYSDSLSKDIVVISQYAKKYASLSGIVFS